MVLIVMTTVPNAAEADSLALMIVTEKLAGCVQVLPPIRSVYIWEGSLHTETEHLLLIKTLPQKYESLSEFIKANHSYAVPEIVAFESDKVSEPYLTWMKDVIN